MTNPNTGKVSMTVWVDPPPEGQEWYQESRGWIVGEFLVHFVLRPIVPATVMVENLRADVEFYAQCQMIGTMENPANNPLDRHIAACRAALARKPLCRDCGYPEQAHATGEEGPLDGNVCRRFTLERKPCPVMVCPMGREINGYHCCDREVRRRCKHEAGHGGAHE